MQDNIHIGNILSEFFKKNKVSVAVLARTYPCYSSNIFYHLKQRELSTGILFRYSHIFKHNFLLDIAMQLPKEYTTASLPDPEKDALIAALKDEVRILKIERDLLKDVLGK